MKNFRLLDDDFCTKVFEDIECVELLLRIILNKDDLKVTKVHSQYNMKNLQGRSAKLDIFAINSTGDALNVEIQRSDRGAVPRRARYHSSLIDANVTEPGDKSDREGVLIMCRMLEEMRNETALETALKTTKEFALRLIIRGKDTPEEIAEITKLPLAEINHLKETQQI